MLKDRAGRSMVQNSGMVILPHVNRVERGQLCRGCFGVVDGIPSKRRERCIPIRNVHHAVPV